MKKLMKFSKLLLLIATIFSYVSSPIAVLAEEITSKSLNILLAAIDEDNDGYIDNYELTCKSLNSEYDEDKTYEVKLETVFTYMDGTTFPKNYDDLSATGSELNSEDGKSFELDSISKYYNGTYTLSIAVYDGETVIYEDSNYVYNYNTLVGLTGKLNEIMPNKEVVGSTTTGKYNVTDEGGYTQKLSVLTGELSPNGKYRVVYDDNTYSEIMTGEELRNSTFIGTVTDLTGKLFGTYSYTDVITFEEVTGSGSEYEVVNTYTYNYNANIAYCTDNDELFSNLYGITFENGYMIVNAKGLYDTEEVITIGELLDTLNGSDISLEVLDEEDNALDLALEEVLAMEVKNNYRVRFTKGATAEYVVVVKGDATLDNEFTSDDLVGVMEGYLKDDNMPSMDMVALEEEVENENGETITEREEFGTITFEDVMFTNELLKENDSTGVVENNANLVLEFGELPEEVFVGDTISLDVLVRSDNDLDYIDGIDGKITTSDNLRLVSIESSDTFNGMYDSETGRLVGAGLPLTNGTVVMTLVFDVVGEGTGNITLSGKTAKYLNISDFDTMTKELEIARRISTNNNLSSLKASVGKFDVEFDKDVTVYTLTVPYDTESVILSGELEDVYASVDGLVEYKLTEDKTTAIVNVTAEDESVKTYTIYIVKEAKPVTIPVVYYYSSNNYLKSLEIDGYEIEFNKDTNEYKITVKSDVTSLDIKALAEDSRSRVEITGNENFKEGENIVTITVTAEDGSTREYKLVVDKEEKKQAIVTDENSNTAEKVVIVILIVLVVLGLLYLIFKKDDGEVKKELLVKKEESKDNKNSVNKNTNTNKSGSKNKKK